jgi:hypothetical protein
MIVQLFGMLFLQLEPQSIRLGFLRFEEWVTARK